ncbi:helix-turn-helix domain-containing protein [Methylobacterium sp. 10]|uniref:helix-turn-helix domain-containing protein n=1 Tax=Methylobacterium sp. 10 TaxID=1101191 RepID=UPI0004B30E28|nr:helix-turn-helix domain-containing protein [Methylobacterium sp. 10]
MSVGPAATEVVVSFFLARHGSLEQGNCGLVVGVGDIGFIRLDRPFAVGGLSPYREIRFSVPRSDFEARVGNADALAGRRIRASPSTELLAIDMHDVAQSATGMCEAEVGIAVEGRASHPELIGRRSGRGRRGSGFARHAPGLARARTERHSHDGSYGPQAMAAALNVSRSKLYRAFADGEGIAAEIRDARLGRVHRWLTAASNDRTPINVMKHACGFTDAPGFGKAFKGRFGMSPKDARALRRG